jgi:hypothetical protein
LIPRLWNQIHPATIGGKTRTCHLIDRCAIAKRLATSPDRSARGAGNPAGGPLQDENLRIGPTDPTIQDYAELARLGRVTRARITQIMKLLDLAPDIQEQILFLPLIQGLNERSLRPLASRIDWAEQRRMFQKITWPCVYCFGALRPLPPRLSTGAATTGAGAGFNTVA